MSQQFKTPILATIYNVSGCLVIVLGMLGSMISVFSGTSGSLPALTALGSIFIALPLFGIAQLISYIGKTAYYAEMINDSLTTSTYQTAKTLNEISHLLQAAGARDEANPSIPPPPVGAICPYCNAKIPSSQVQKGENTCPKCNNSFVAE